MTRLRLLLFALASVLVVSAAHGQSSGHPTYSVGDTWTFTNRTLEVIKVEGDVVVMRGVNAQCPTCIYYFDKNYMSIITITTEDGSRPDSGVIGWLPVGTEWKFFDHPLEVNKTWRISSAQGFYRRTPALHTVDFTVETYEDVVTKAGTFKAFRIRQDWTRRSIQFSAQQQWTEYVWWAPDVKVSVKWVRGKSPSGDSGWELVSYRLK